MTMLAGLPALVALVVSIVWSTESAFLNVYLPTLLLVPDECRMNFSGQMSFAESAILPIAILHLWKARKEWRSTFTDGLIFAFVLMWSISEYLNTDAILAKNLVFHLATSLVLPYLVGKCLITQERTAREVAKKITLLATLVVIMSFYEVRMTISPFRALMAPLFPDLNTHGIAVRYHLIRISGPWTHPILAGIILATAYRITRWLDWTGYWPGEVPFLGVSKVRFCEVTLLVGSAMTISRGPWIGAALAAVILIIVQSKHRLYTSVLIVSLVCLVGGPIYSSFSSYVNVKREAFGADNEAQLSAAYRREMNNKYLAIVEERPTWGWGAANGHGLYPVVDGMSSIDNHYLLVALVSGLYTLGLLLLLFFWMSIRLFSFALRYPSSNTTTLLAMTLGGIFVLYLVSLFTVYLGAQTQPLLFFFAGWSEALLLGRGVASGQVVSRSEERAAFYRFERVMV